VEGSDRKENLCVFPPFTSKERSKLRHGRRRAGEIQTGNFSKTSQKSYRLRKLSQFHHRNGVSSWASQTRNVILNMNY
jgi:hypothetical protein